MSNGPPRVVWVIDAPAYGGAELYVLRCMEGLDADSWLAVAEPVPHRLLQVLAEHDLLDRLVRVPRVRGKRDLLAFIRLLAQLRRMRADVVHVNANATGNARFGLLAAILGCRAPVVLTVHTSLPLTAWVQRAVVARLYRRCAAVIAVSTQIAVDLRARGVERVHVVRNGVPVPPRPVSPHASAVLRLGALGRLTRQKGMDLVIEAVRLLAADHVAVHLDIGGAGPEADSLRAATAGLPVALLGEVTDVPAWWSTLDVFVLPSRWEGLPFVLLEAMAAGLPVVATDVGDVRDAVADAGIIVPVEDPVALARALRTLTDTALRSTLGRAGRDRVLDGMSEEAMLRSTAEVFAAAGRPLTLRRRP